MRQNNGQVVSTAMRHMNWGEFHTKTGLINPSAEMKK